MPRLIDADALVKDFNICFGGVSHAVIAKNLIDNAPTIEAEPVRHGRWIKKVESYHDSHTGEYWDEEYCSCPFCGKDSDLEHNYCPNCGAKMDGE